MEKINELDNNLKEEYLKEEYLKYWNRIISLIKSIKTSNINDNMKIIFEIQDKLEVLNEAPTMYNLDEVFDNMQEEREVTNALLTLSKALEDARDIAEFIKITSVLNNLVEANNIIRNSGEFKDSDWDIKDS